ncbi:MAG: TerC family protein [Desulfomicrobium sp.]|nr:TerC family protein [Desulfomicrobium sp.]
MSPTEIMWAFFWILILLMFSADLFLNRKSHIIGFREAAGFSLAWFTMAMIFNLAIWHMLGTDKALEFLAGYLLEQSLSVDNLFVFIMIFSVFGVRQEYQSRVLKWGIIGAIVLRFIFIFVGSALLREFQWLFYVFGVLLIYTAWKMAFTGDDEMHPENNPLIRLARRILPMTKRIQGDWFYKRRMGVLMFSPLFLVLLVVESSDVIFALDSIPAIFAITLDPFIVLTSNIFAVMGLRSLYFLLSNLVGMFGYLKYGIAFILAFVGVKMLLIMSGIHIPTVISLAVILLSLALAVIVSIVTSKKQLAAHKHG